MLVIYLDQTWKIHFLSSALTACNKGKIHHIRELDKTRVMWFFCGTNPTKRELSDSLKTILP